MTIQINGKPAEINAASTLAELLETLGFSGKPVVVEHNKTAIFPRDYPHTLVKDGDTLEIISIAAGG